MRKTKCKWIAVLLGSVLLAGCCGAQEAARTQKANPQEPTGMMEISEIAIFCACPCECCKKCPKCQKNPCKKAVCPEKKNCPVKGKKENCPVKEEKPAAEKTSGAQPKP